MAEATTADAADDEEETLSAVTWLEANNADTQAILLGRHDDGQVLEMPELDDGTPVRVRRYFEPQEVVELPGPMDKEAVVEWVEEHQDHPKFEDFDFDAGQRRGYLDTIVANRDSARQTLAHFVQRLENLTVVGVEAQEELDDILSEMADEVTAGPSVSVNRVEEAEEAEE